MFGLHLLGRNFGATATQKPVKHSCRWEPAVAVASRAQKMIEFTSKDAKKHSCDPKKKIGNFRNFF
jgi:hypothetical protein